MTAGTTVKTSVGDTRQEIVALLKRQARDHPKAKFHNADPMARLFGSRNLADISVNDETVTALLDTGAEISTVSMKFCLERRLQILPLDDFFKLKGAGHNDIPYYGLVDVKISAPHVPSYCENTLLLVVDHFPYHDEAPLTLGTLTLHGIVKAQKSDSKLPEAWELVSTTQELVNASKLKPRFDLAQVHGAVKSTHSVTLKPGETKRVKGTTPVTVHCHRLHVMTTQPTVRSNDSWNLETSYAMMTAHDPRVPVVLSNPTDKTIRVKRGSVVGVVHAANAVPPSFFPGPADPTKPLPSAELVGDGKPVPKRPLSEEQRKEFLSKLNLGCLDTWSKELQDRAIDLLCRYENIFSRDELDHGKTSLLKHDIVLTDPVPFRERYRRISPHLYEEVRSHLEEMLRMGAIRRSSSPWASAVVLARRKNGKLRFCIDLRRLNNRTVKDAYTLPRIEETLDCLQGSCLFSALDLKAGYWQVEMTERSRPYTAFTVGPLGFYECDRMPFGLTNAPATFQRLMESCLGDLHLVHCLIYLDDVVIYSKTPGDHLKSLELVFERIEAAGMKLRTEKCSFFQTSLDYLGHIVSAKGIEVSPKGVQAVKDWVVPTTVTQLRSFLGFASRFRRFIKNFAQISDVLYDQIGNESKSEGKKKLISWSPECQEAFDELKHRCSTTPVLAYPDFTLPFLLKTDASKKGLGAILYQKQDGVLRPICFASRALKPSEANYPAHKLEFLCLVWSVTKKFREYLYGGRFDAYTDSNPVTYTPTTAKLDAMTQRWIADLALFDFSIYYKPGVTNVEADALSRIEWPDSPGEEDVRVKVPAFEVKQMFATVTLSDPVALSMRAESVPSVCYCSTLQPADHVCDITPDDDFSQAADVWRRRQSDDAVLSFIKKQWSLKVFGRSDKHSFDAYADWLSRDGATDQILGSGETTAMEAARTFLTPSEFVLYKQYFRLRPQIVLRHGLLFRQKDVHGRRVWQLLLPSSFRERTLSAAHDSMGHMGRDRTFSILEERFFWPGMRRDVESYVSSCSRCIRFKSSQDKAPLQPIDASYPLELVHLDFLKIEDDHDQYRSVLVMTDHFSGFATACVSPNESALNTAKLFLDHWCCVYGFPDRILTDQGRNFESKLLSEMCALLGMEKLRTTPYHPMCNGQVERFNATLLNMIGTLNHKQKSSWPKLLKLLTLCYNGTRHRVTGYSPHFLMFGWSPRLPIDWDLGLPLPGSWLPGSSKLEYVKKLRKQLQWASRVAQKARRLDSLKDKARYDSRVKGASLAPGDLCLIRVTQHQGKHKISDKWSEDIYEVVTVKRRLVYEVRPVVGHGSPRTLHRNLLLPLAGRLRDVVQMTDADMPDSNVSTAEPVFSAPALPEEDSDVERFSTPPSSPVRRSSRTRKQPERFEAS